VLAVPPSRPDTWPLLRATDAQIQLGELTNQPNVVASARMNRVRLFGSLVNDVLNDETRKEHDWIFAACHYVLARLQVDSGAPTVDSARAPQGHVPSQCLECRILGHRRLHWGK
jgi:hypothetical protein